MIAPGPPPQGAGQKSRQRAAALWLFGAVLLLSFWRFWNLRAWREFPDESDNISAGWLIGKGFRLYDTLFEPHMPAAYIVAHLTDALIPVEGYSKFRAAMWLCYAVAAASFLASPIFRSVTARAVAGSAFLALATIAAPAWWGEMLLGENIYGAGVVVFLNLFLLVKVLAPEAPIPPAQLAIAGFFLGWWVSGSLVTLYPLLIVVAITAGLHYRAAVSWRDLKLLLSGFALIGALELFWLLRFGSLPGFFEQAIQFNIQVYGDFLARQLGYEQSSIFVIATDAVRHAIANAVWFRESGIDSLTALFVAVALPMLAVWLRSAWPVREWLLLGAACMILVISLRARRGEFHGAPYYLSVICLLSWALVYTARKSRRMLVLAASAGMLCIAASVFVAIRAIAFRTPLTPGTLKDPALAASVHYVREHTSPEERVVAIPMQPGFYYAAQRMPAHSGVFYLPWNAAWERRFGKRDTCAELKLSRPRFIRFHRRSVWGYPVTEYAACIDQFISESYREVDMQRYPHLFVRNEQ